MFRAASIAPAPKPSGIPHRQSHQIELEYASPNKAMAVKSVQRAVTIGVPNLFIMRALKKLAVTEPSETIAETTLCIPACKLSSAYIAGHAAPIDESGKPRPINTVKIITNSNVATKFTLKIILYKAYHKIG